MENGGEGLLLVDEEEKAPLSCGVDLTWKLAGVSSAVIIQPLKSGPPFSFGGPL